MEPRELSDSRLMTFIHLALKGDKHEIVDELLTELSRRNKERREVESDVVGTRN